MVRTSKRLSVFVVRAKQTPGRYADGDGLYLQVTPSGKSWLFRFMLSGRSREMGLGSVKLVSLAEARQKALEQRKLLLDGIDPIDHRRANRPTHQAPTFSEAATAYIESHQMGWKNAKHAAQWKATLKTYAEPVLGQIPVDQIDTDLVLRVLLPIWGTKSETASRVRGRMESVLSWAKARGYRSGENPAQWRGHLDQTLPKRNKVRPVKHHPALPYKEFPAFMAKLAAEEGTAARALEFTILTASRTNEVISARWAEFDLEGKKPIWTIPENRMKAGKEHRVPLAQSVVRLLRGLPRLGDYVFESRINKPISNAAMRMVLRGMKRQDITVHGFRSTFRDWCGEETSFSREVVEAALAHQLKDRAEAAYRRGDALERRRTLMCAWVKHAWITAEVKHDSY